MPNLSLDGTKELPKVLELRGSIGSRQLALFPNVRTVRNQVLVLIEYSLLGKFAGVDS